MFSQAIMYFPQRRNALVTCLRTRPRPRTFSSTATSGCNLSKPTEERTRAAEPDKGEIMRTSQCN